MAENAVGLERMRPLPRQDVAASNLVGFRGLKPDTGILPQDVVSTTPRKHQIGAIPTLDRNSQQAKIAGRFYGLTDDLRGH